jgi:predicted RNA-binding Zn ribbon-like protein
MADDEDGDRTPAPGRLKVVQELLNTVDLEGGDERFTSPERAAAWLCEKGLLGSEDQFSDADLERLLRLREALRDLAATNHGDQLSSDTVATVNGLAGGAPLVVQVDRDGSLALAPCVGGAAGVTASVLAIVQAAAVEGTWARLKVCRSGTCRWAFYDRSRNRSGSWCSMAVCGNRAKVRTFRQRRSTA